MREMELRRMQINREGLRLTVGSWAPMLFVLGSVPYSTRRCCDIR